MESTLPALAFALLIGGQFLAAIFLISKRHSVYSRPDAAVRIERTGSIKAVANFAEPRLAAKAV